MTQRVCLDPYTIESPSFDGQTGTVFIDNTKTRRVAVITPCNSRSERPSIDAVLLYEIDQCPFSGCSIQWYECPSELGRTYTLLPTGCDVVITSFENGLLLSGKCDARIFGSRNFCFGKIYSGEGINRIVRRAPSQCESTFDFDGHTFNVKGKLSENYGLFDCGNCQQIEQKSEKRSCRVWWNWYRCRRN